MPRRLRRPPSCHRNQLHAYIREGGRAAVLVDPADESVGVLRPGEDFQILRGEELLSLPEIAEELSIRIDELFATLRQ